MRPCSSAATIGALQLLLERRRRAAEPSSRQNTSSRPSRLIASIRIFWPRSSSKRAGHRMRWLPSGTRSSRGQPDHAGRRARSPGSKRSKLMPGGMVSSRSAERGEVLQRVARDMLRHGDHRVGARLAALDEAVEPRSCATNGGCRVAMHLTSSRRATARATHAVAGERAWTTLTSASRRLATSLRRQREARPQRMAARRATRGAWRAAAAARAPVVPPGRGDDGANRRPRSRPAPHRAWRGRGRRRRATERSAAASERARQLGRGCGCGR